MRQREIRQIMINIPYQCDIIYIIYLCTYAPFLANVKWLNRFIFVVSYSLFYTSNLFCILTNQEQRDEFNSVLSASEEECCSILQIFSSAIKVMGKHTQDRFPLRGYTRAAILMRTIIGCAFKSRERDATRLLRTTGNEYVYLLLECSLLGWNLLANATLSLPACVSIVISCNNIIPCILLLGL